MVQRGTNGGGGRGGLRRWKREAAPWRTRPGLLDADSAPTAAGTSGAGCGNWKKTHPALQGAGDCAAEWRVERERTQKRGPGWHRREGRHCPRPRLRSQGRRSAADGRGSLSKMLQRGRQQSAAHGSTPRELRLSGFNCTKSVWQVWGEMNWGRGRCLRGARAGSGARGPTAASSHPCRDSHTSGSPHSGPPLGKQGCAAVWWRQWRNQRCNGAVREVHKMH